ncbi:MAG: prolipoprotein diacylglyceryl transferase [Deltaproteobacteria bacterium]|nr:prolipoprotein diacylglyceryl transferase [Deltaproteobacteria bacterium]
MIPQLFHIPFPLFGDLKVNSFGLMVALALLAAIQLMSRSFERNGINPALADKYVLGAGLSGLFGARIWYILEHYSDLKHDLLGALFSTAGFTFYGGFIFAALVVIVMTKRDRISIGLMADSFGPSLALGYAIGRLGCQLSGDGDYGIATESLWGMSYATGVIPTPPGELALPTPLYESSICMGILYVLLKLEVHPKWQVPFKRFGAYLVLIAAERFVVEFWRINPKVLGTFSEAQVIAVLLVLVGGYLVFSRRQTTVTS